MEMTENQAPTQPEEMSEDDVKQLFTPFLREFYKYRYAIEPGTSQATFDNVGEGGIIADGKLTFLKSDGEDLSKKEYFTCTFEATSRAKMDEIKFQPNIGYLVWDSVAFASAAVTLFFILSYFSRTSFLIGFGWFGSLGLVIGFGIILFSVWFFLMKNWRKYRYIYAIEQFRQYFADEQWCAIAGDIFVSPTDPFLLELRDQCMFNGFGLAIVEADGSVRPLATPSRLGIFGRDRRIVDLFSENRIYQNLAGGVATVGRMREAVPDIFTVALNKIWQPINFYAVEPIKTALWRVVAKPFGLTQNAYSRFRGSFEIQKTVTALSLIFLVFFLWKVAQHRQIEFADEDFFEKNAERVARQANPEDYRGYVVDNEPIRYGAIPKQYPNDGNLRDDDDVQTIQLSENEEDENVQTINLSGDDEDDALADEPETEPAAAKNIAPKPTISANQTRKPAAKTTDSGCQFLSGKKGYVVQDGFFSDKIFADERLKTLRHRGLKMVAVPSGCVSKTAPSGGYFIFWEQTFSTEKTALSELENYRKTLARYSLLQAKPAILRQIR